MLHTTRKGLRRDDSGFTILETAVVVAIVFMLIGGVVAIGVIGDRHTTDIPEEGFRSAIGAAGDHAAKNSTSTTVITAADVLANGFKSRRGVIEIAGSPTEGYCVRAAEDADGPWAYYDSADGSLNIDPRPAPRTGPCHDADWKTLR